MIVIVSCKAKENLIGFVVRLRLLCWTVYGTSEKNVLRSFCTVINSKCKGDHEKVIFRTCRFRLLKIHAITVVSDVHRTKGLHIAAYPIAVKPVERMNVKNLRDNLKVKRIRNGNGERNKLSDRQKVKSYCYIKTDCDKASKNYNF